MLVEMFSDITSKSIHVLYFIRNPGRGTRFPDTDVTAISSLLKTIVTKYEVLAIVG